MPEFQVINDDVMGGQSRSRLLRTATGPLFEGDVSLANGGGFASFRAPLRLADVRAFGLLTGEGQSGHFRVELELPHAG
jgi:hypothetical protein